MIINIKNKNEKTERKMIMKKMKVLLITGILSGLFMTACNSNNSAQAQQPQGEVANLQQQVGGTGAADTGVASTGVTTPVGETTTPAAVPDANANPVAGTTPATAVQGQVGIQVKTIEELTTLTNAAVEKVNAAAPAGSRDEQIGQFFQIKDELKAVEREIDYYDDELEIQFKSGAMDRMTYVTKDREVDLLEDQLDRAEDMLEIKFGIND